ncbi:MAG: hypothetical protein WB766_04420, partial [Roseiarcus sp.]
MSRRRLCAFARDQIELGNLDALLWRFDQRRAAVQLIYNIEYLFIALVRRGLRREQSADSKVSQGPLVFGDQRIGGLLDAVMDKRVGAVRAV